MSIETQEDGDLRSAVIALTDEVRRLRADLRKPGSLSLHASDDEKPEFLHLDEVCRIARVGPSTVYYWLRNGKLPSRLVGRRRLIPRAAVEQMIAPKIAKETSR